MYGTFRTRSCRRADGPQKTISTSIGPPSTSTCPVYTAPRTADWLSFSVTSFLNCSSVIATMLREMVLVGKVKVHVCTDAVLYRTVFSSSSYKRGDQRDGTCDR